MAESILVEYFKTPVGELILGSFNDKLCICDWHYRKKRESIDQRIKSNLQAEYVFGSSKVIELTKTQLSEYFNNKRREFDIPPLLIGSDFQQQVWAELLKIPFGKTLSYLELSIKMGNEKAIRAVASANGANAISIVVPCHRVIGADGGLTGYAGGLQAKKKLLDIEGALGQNQLNLFDS